MWICQRQKSWQYIKYERMCLSVLRSLFDKFRAGEKRRNPVLNNKIFKKEQIRLWPPFFKPHWIVGSKFGKVRSGPFQAFFLSSVQKGKKLSLVKHCGVLGLLMSSASIRFSHEWWSWKCLRKFEAAEVKDGSHKMHKQLNSPLSYNNDNNSNNNKHY